MSEDRGGEGPSGEGREDMVDGATGSTGESRTGEPPIDESLIGEPPIDESLIGEPPTGDPPIDEDDAALLRLAEEIADGLDIDWDRARTEESLDPGRSRTGPLLESLQAIEAFAIAMRENPPPRAPAPGLEPGRVLGRFVVEGRAGSGGMGDVYLARDRVLERPVALKVLPSTVVHSPDRLARLAHEARVLASLNHPTIATIYGMEEIEGVRFLVLEWVPSGSLADRLGRGPLPLHDALVLCAQIARGVAAAHAEGVIHRDIKPSNVMLTPDGRAKVVDFGLAHRDTPAAETGSRVDAPARALLEEAGTEVDAAKQAGAEDTLLGLHSSRRDSGRAIAGTLGYASPERLEGKEDARGDVFSFGCVLFECLVGKPAFTGQTAGEVHHAVLHGTPDLASLPRACPASIRKLLAHCLEKDPDRRPASISEATRVIEEALEREGRTGRARSNPTDTRLPLPATSFIGRDRELEHCRARLGPGELLTLTGPGGSGKTRLALAVARSFEPELADGAWFLDAGTVSEGARLIEAFATTIGLVRDPARPLLDQVLERFRQSDALVVLDNCETLPAECGDLAQKLLADSAALRLLATSRTPLYIDGERTVPVDPLPVPADGDDPESLEQCESVALFLERAAEADPRFAPDAAALRSVAEICRGVEGLPLAIELAAARVRVLSVGEIADRLDRQLQLLRDGTGRMPPRHRALQAVIEWSVQQLRPEERDMFHMLSFFPGGATLPAATQVAGLEDEFDTLDRISALVDRSLVVVQSPPTGASRYRLLEPVRQFAAAALETEGDLDGVRKRHAAHFLALAEEAEPKLFGPEQAHWLDRVGAEHANFLVALDSFFQDPAGIQQGLRLAGALGRYWHVRGFPELAATQLDRMLGRSGAEEPTPARAHALFLAGALASWRGAQDLAVVSLEEALQLFRRLGNRQREVRALLALATAYRSGGDRDRGRRVCEEGLEAARAVGDTAGEATILLNLGVMISEAGDPETAHGLFGQAVDLHRKSGDRVTLALALGNRSGLSVQLGRFDAAAPEIAEALTLAREIGSVWAGTSAIAACGTMALARGDATGAAWMFAAAKKALERSGVGLSPGQRSEMDGIVGRIRDELGEDDFPAAWKEGESLSFDLAADRVLSWIQAATDR